MSSYNSSQKRTEFNLSASWNEEDTEMMNMKLNKKKEKKNIVPGTRELDDA